MTDAAGSAESGGPGDRRGTRSGEPGGAGYRRLFAGLLIAAWASAALVALAPWTPLRAAGGLLLVGALPGALATYATLPPFSRIDGRLRAVLAVALSVAIALVLGLGLALITDEVSRVAAAAGLGIAATVAALVAFARENGEVAPPRPRWPGFSPAVAIVSGLLAVAAIALVVAALGVDSLPTKFTALALTREDDGVRLSVSSKENRTMKFRYIVRDGGGVRLYSGAMRIGPGEESAVLLPVTAGTGLVRAQLYAGGGGPPYRSVALRL